LAQELEIEQNLNRKLADKNTKRLNEKATALNELNQLLANEQRLRQKAEALPNRNGQASTELLETRQQLANEQRLRQNAESKAQRMNQLKDQLNFEQQAKIEIECRLKENEKLKELMLTEGKNLSSEGVFDNF